MYNGKADHNGDCEDDGRSFLYFGPTIANKPSPHFWQNHTIKKHTFQKIVVLYFFL